MKHLIQNILLLAILLVPATFTACSNEDTIYTQPTTYTLTVQASKGSDVATARALSLSGTTLNASWAVGEAVTVYNVTKSADLGGTLSAQTNGSSTTLSGTLTGSIEVNDELTLKFLNPAYSTQDGTLTGNATSIDKVCDYATATVKVTAVSGGNVTTTAASFSNQQAIVKFTLKDKADGSTSLSATTLVVTVDGNTYTVNTSATSEVYVAIPGISDKEVTLTATTASDTYEYKKTGVTFTNGQYYTVNVKMTRLAKAADLGKVMAQNGCIYDNIASVPSSTTAVGMIAYVGDASNCTHGLAIALADETGTYTFGTAAGVATNKNTSLHVVGGTWRIPSKEDWQNMFLACRKEGDASSADTNMTIAGFKEKISAVGTGFTNGDTYWTSTDSPSVYGVYFSSPNQATFQANQNKMEGSFKARAVLAF